VFDAPTMTADNESQRFRSALPTQSLALLNNPLVMRTTKAFTEQVLEQSQGDFDAALAGAFDSAYSRPPSQREIVIAKSSIEAEAEPKEGLRLFVQAMFGANDFLYSF
jgi:hypothetical protein